MFRLKTYISLLCLISVNLFTHINHSNAQQLSHQPYAPDYSTPCNNCLAGASALATPQASTWDQQPDAQPVGANYFAEDQIADNPWFVRLGVAVILFGEGSTIRANGAVVPGAGVDISDATTFAFDIGYQLSPVWTATFSTGVPPKLDITGTGPFGGLPYGTTRFAPVALTLQRHFFVTPKTSIYVGGGINYNIQYKTIDGAIRNFDIDNDAAVVLQLGVERRINDRISLFADAKKAFYRTQAFGNLGPASIRTDVTANSTVLAFGLKYDF